MYFINLLIILNVLLRVSSFTFQTFEPHMKHRFPQLNLETKQEKRFSSYIITIFFYIDFVKSIG